MALQKSNLAVNFAQGLDTKTDPFQVQPGKMLSLQNTIFTKGGLLQKRNGFQKLPSLPTTSYKFLTTFNLNLTAVGTTLSAFSDGSDTWVSKGSISPIDLDTLPLFRSGSNQSQCDTAIASNGLICTVFTDTAPSTVYKYVISDSRTGQNIVAATTIATPSESPRVFLLGNYFFILYSQAAALKYVAINVNNPSSPNAAVSIITNYAIGGTQLAFDAIVANNNIYIAYNASDGGGAIRMTYLNSNLVQQTATTGTNVANGKSATMVSVCADTTESSAVIWVSWYKLGTTEGWVLAVDPQLTSILVATQIIAAGTILNITAVAQSMSVSVFYEVSTAYSYGGQTNIINTRSVTQAGVVGTASTILRSVGLASKAFLLSGTAYMLSAYSSSYQPSYFLINSSGAIVAKLAYSNGGGYLTLGLPSVTVTDTEAQVAYLIKDLIQAANKSQSPISSTPVFTQTGINLATFDFTSDELNSSEIGSNLHFSGGILWAYDGQVLVEQGFNVYPDNVVVTTSAAGGSLKDQTYYYVAVYEWTDNQGNIHRSAPSLAVKQITAGGNTSTNTVKVPTLRLTYKTNTPVKIVIYRWSTDFQTYYQVTSLTSPTLNSTTADSIAFTDTFADSSIVGNSILYTTGGVVENIGPPGTTVMSLFKSRLFLVDDEDRNLLWYSKQVIEATPVEFSDLFTLYVAPTISAQGNTGPITALSAMDDKLIIFKKDAIYYLTGLGPDNTGANNDFTDAVFITSTVGCDNQRSIVFIPQGLLFQSDKGIWLLGRDLSTMYIGAPVENFNEDIVLSALTVPGTNQVRFTLDSGVTLMYDYFFNQWGTFVNVPGISSTLYLDAHTYIDAFGQVFQENPGSYLDGSTPVLMSFTTGWFNLAGLQGFQRAYFFYLLGTYYSPHKLSVQIAYDYKPANQTVLISPDNFSGQFGDDPLFGSGSPMGGPSNIENWKVFFSQQKCEAFQIQINEVFDGSFGTMAGQGLTLSGLDLVVGMKSAYPRLRAANSAG